MKIHILGDGTEVRRVDGNKNKKTIVIEEAALDSLKKMVEQLQAERDVCLNALKSVIDSVDMCDGDIAVWADCFDTARAAIAKCTSKPEVLA